MYQLAQASACIALRKAKELLYLGLSHHAASALWQGVWSSVSLEIESTNPSKTLIFPNYDLQHDIS